MLKSEPEHFSSSECENLKSLLKDPDHDFQKLISILEKKVIERTERIKESEDKYHSLLTVLTNIGFGIDIITKDYEILYQNQVLKERFGDNLGELCFEKYMGEKNSCSFCQMEDTLKYNEIKRNELKAVDNRTYEIISAPYPNPDGTLDKVLEVIIDITERKLVEQKLRDSEEKFRLITEQSSMGIFIIQNGKFRYINQGVSEITGYSVEEMITWTGLDIAKTIDKEDIEEIMNRLKRSEKGDIDEKSSSIFRVITKSGKLKWVEEYNKKINYEGKPASLVSLIDITSKIESEQKLKESEIRYHHLFEHFPISISLFNSKGNLVESNRIIMKKLAEYANIDFVGKNYMDIIPYFQNGDHLLRLFSERLKALLKGENPRPIELLLITKIGKKVWLYWESSRIEINNELFFEVLIQDITERKDAEEKLKESEEKFRNIAEQSLIGFGIVQDNIIKYANEKFADIFGYTIDEILHWNPEEFLKTVHPEDKDFVFTQAKKKQQGLEDYLRNYVFKGIKKSGETIWIENHTRSITYDGRPADFVALIDITERRKMEQKLKESEENFRTIAEDSHLAITILQDDLVVYTNQRMADMFGYKREEMLNWTPKEYAKTVAEDNLDFIMAQARKKQIGDLDVITHYPIHGVKSSGEKFWVDNISTTIIYNGRPADLVTLIDITDKRQAEQKLKESEEKFRNIAEQSLMGIIILQDGVFKYFNDRISEMNGYSVEEMTNWAPHEFGKAIYYKDREFVMEQARKKQAGDSDVVNHYRYRTLRKNGEIRWMEIFSKTINYEGRPADLAMIIDINDKIKAEQQLKESEEKFRKITEESLLAICIIQDDVIKYVNQEMAHLYGYSVEEMLNWGPDEFLKTVASESLEIVREQLRKKQTGDPDIIIHYPIKCIKSNGDFFWVDNLSKTMLYEGRPADLVTQIDITERIKAQQELIKLNQLKSELLRRTSHELKTPLVSIKGFSDLLLQVHRDKLDNFVISTINEIKQGCVRLENLITDILKTAELESGAIQLNKSRENLSFLVKVCINEIKGLSRLRNHAININMPENLITHFEKEQIHQVISNILSNAVKFTPPGGLIEIKSEIKDDIIILSIKDSGIGFTEDEKTRIFKQFGKIERYGQGLDIIAEGSGFGLFISKKIVELHGGDIWVESEGRNKGSSFYISLPLI
ncbi:MAG: PAS domain S-box protein [Candidatus Hodarchaeota archaeon]